MEEKGALTFWGHLDELRGVLFRIAGLVFVTMLTAFLAKETLFQIILAPGQDDFVLYQVLRRAAQVLHMPSLAPDHFSTHLISTELSQQFLIHCSTALYAGMLVSSPYIIYALFSYVSPALYPNEKRSSLQAIFASFFLFASGVALSYFLIFPLSFRFLATYQVTSAVINTITLESYMNTFWLLCLMMGILFQVPILCWLLGYLGVLTSSFMRQYRRYAIVIILIAAAIITPTSDIFTLLIVALPIYFLYEGSIYIVSHVERKRKAKQEASDAACRLAEKEWEDPYRY